MGPVYGTTSLLHLQERSLTSAIVGFFTAMHKAPAASASHVFIQLLRAASSYCSLQVGPGKLHI